MVYPALLPLMRTPRLPVVDWTDAPADFSGLVRFAERRNLVSACVPSHFNIHKEVAALAIYATVIRRRAIMTLITRVRNKMHKMTAKWTSRVTFPNSSTDFDDLFFQPFLCVFTVHPSIIMVFFLPTWCTNYFFFILIHLLYACTFRANYTNPQEVKTA
jgi:hypothetical protein